jgi:ankyrin repeat protein
MSGTDREILTLLLDNGVDVKAIDEQGETALHKLMDRNEFPIELLEDILKAGADVNKDDSSSRRKSILQYEEIGTNNSENHCSRLRIVEICKR